MIEIVPVTDARQRDAFIRLPGRISAGDPHWVEPLHLDRRHFMDAGRNPFFTHAEVAFFLAMRDGQPVGRISAQIDALAPPAEGRKLGMFGMVAFEDDPAVPGALFETAEGWLRDRGAEVVRGPYDLGPNQECGALVEGFDTPPFLLITHNPRHVAPAIEAQGYAKARDLLSYRVTVRDGLPDGPRRLIGRSDPSITIRSLDIRRYPEEIATVAGLFNQAWAGNWGFVPLTEAEVAGLVRDLRPIIDPGLVKIAERDGEGIGFIVLLPDVNEAIRDLGGRLLPFGWAKLLWRLKANRIRGARVPLMGVRPDVAETIAGKILAYQLIYALEDRYLERRFEELELSWLLEDNMGVRRVVESIGASVAKVHRLYEKHL
ncbi:MAG: dATP pyrophosphohydrolase [Pseudomonadota bacterium]